jgi:hypothetical protein
MAAMVCLVGMTRDAGATVTISMVWTSTTGSGTGVGTDTITALPGDIIQLDLRMSTNQTLSGHAVSVVFDTDLANELNVLGAGGWSGSSFGTSTMNTTYGAIGANPSPSTDSTGAAGGIIPSWNGGQLSGPGFLPTGTYTIGTARFVVNGSVATDGADLFSGLFNTLTDGFGDNTFSLIPTSALVFNSATVNVIPEPGTVSLLGLGLVGLILAGRRSRRS